MNAQFDARAAPSASAAASDVPVRPHVSLRGVFKVFGSHVAVRDLDLDVAEGEFLVLVGPSGCGKTTTLRMLAGLERPSFGTIEIRGRVVNAIAPKERNIALVFQGYALYPHMTVRQNLAFGLRARREARATVRSKVVEVARTLELEEQLDRRPSELSGGQRQRVALGRALIREPDVFLMDEPLSNLDAGLRLQMRGELVRLHRRLGATMVYVTHDQVEAMTMGTRIAVMRDGVLQQVGVPQHLYDQPANLFVAGFIGSPKMNMAPGRIVPGAGDEVALEWLGQRCSLSGALAAIARRADAPDVVVGIRPEDLRSRGAEDDAKVRGRIEILEPLGPETLATVAIESEIRVIARLGSRAGVSLEDSIDLAFSPDHLHLFDPTNGLNFLYQ